MMKKLLALLSLCCSIAAHAAPQFTDLAGLYDDVWQRNVGKPESERLADFRKTVVERFPQFYGLQRFEGKTQADLDRRWAKSFAGYEALRPAYLDVVRQFDGEIGRHTASFLQTFPDYRDTIGIVLVHSLGEFDGGTRTLGGRDYLLFGADMIARLHRGESVAPLFHHELFHVHHDAHFSDCEGRLWPALWREGLATYVSAQMNPQASDSELLLAFPAGMKETTQQNLQEALADLEERLTRDDSADYPTLFNIGGPGTATLPPRRGYYLGYLIAARAGKSHTLAQLARMGCAEAREAVFGGIRALRQDGAAH